MEGFIQFFNEYKYVIVPTSLWIGIQVFKVIYESIEKRKFMPKIFFRSGGMPSSHSAVVTSLATLIARYEGIQTPAFAVACFFAFITMYDAAGVRRAVGKQAKVINSIVDIFNDPDLSDGQKLQELTGHSPFQVIVGALIGFFVALIV